MITKEQYANLVEKYIDTVYRVALSFTGQISDAEDVTQTVFETLLRQSKEFESEDHLKHWLIRVSINACKKLFRSAWRRIESIDDHAAALTFPSPEHSDLFYAVVALPLKYRAPIYLYYYEQYSTTEIAQILKIPKGTVCTNLDRGRQIIKKQLQEANPNEG